MSEKFLPYAHQHISAEDVETVAKALAQPMITRGPLVKQFEQAIAAYCQAAFAVAFNSATAGLMAAYAAAEVGPADTILTTANTYVCTVGSGVQRSATPVFIDIDRGTGNLDLEQLLPNLNRPSSRGKTIVVPVHFAGIPVDMQTIDKHITQPNTLVIEDAAQALGSRYRDGSKVGSCQWSQMTVFSFHPAKIITTGEGGVVTTNDESLYHRLQLYRDNGIERNPEYFSGKPAPWLYEVNFLSGNYNFTEMQAALGISQLQRIDTFIAKRQKLMQAYKKHLASVEHVKMLTPPPNAFVSPHLCVLQIDFQALNTTRTEVMQKLAEKNIGSQVHYIPVYRHPYFAKQMGDLSDFFPETETYYAQALTLPLYHDLTEHDVAYITKTLTSILS